MGYQVINYCFFISEGHYNYKSDEKTLKTLIHRSILPTDPNKKIKLMLYYNQFKSSNLVIKNNSYTLQQYRRSSSYKHTRSYITFVIHSPLMMAQSQAESTWGNE